MFSIVSIVEGERSTNCLKNSKTEDSQHDDGEVREEEEEERKERKRRGSTSVLKATSPSVIV